MALSTFRKGAKNKHREKQDLIGSPKPVWFCKMNLIFENVFGLSSPPNYHLAATLSLSCITTAMLQYPSSCSAVAMRHPYIMVWRHGDANALAEACWASLSESPVWARVGWTFRLSLQHGKFQQLGTCQYIKLRCLFHSLRCGTWCSSPALVSKLIPDRLRINWQHERCCQPKVVSKHTMKHGSLHFLNLFI